MRKVSFALALGFMLAAVACGGDDAQPPKTPATPPVATTTPPAPTAEAPKEDPKPKETLGQLMEKTGRGMVDAMNARDAKKVAGLYAEGGVFKMMTGDTKEVSGRVAIEQNYQQLFTAFGDFKTAPTRLWVKNDVAVLEWAMNGTHTGDLMGGIKATEKKVGVMGVSVMWFTPEGQIKEVHDYLDVGTVLSQIGVSKQKARAIPAMPTSKPEMTMSKGDDAETKNIDAVKAMTAALEAKKEADFLATLSDTVEFDDMTQPQGMKGKADGKKFFKEMTTGFPDAKHTVDKTWAMGDFVITEGTMTGTHKGSFFGIPATKKTLTAKNLFIAQMKDGKMVKGWEYSNGADFAMQLGLAPKPPAAKPDAAAKPADAKKPADAAKPADAKKP